MQPTPSSSDDPLSDSEFVGVEGTRIFLLYSFTLEVVDKLYNSPQRNKTSKFYMDRINFSGTHNLIELYLLASTKYKKISWYMSLFTYNGMGVWDVVVGKRDPNRTLDSGVYVNIGSCDLHSS